jgi:hypothetical protein
MVDAQWESHAFVGSLWRLLGTGACWAVLCPKIRSFWGPTLSPDQCNCETVFGHDFELILGDVLVHFEIRISRNVSLVFGHRCFHLRFSFAHARQSIRMVLLALNGMRTWVSWVGS